MDALNLNWQQLADIGFLLLVTGVSLRSLLVDRDALQKQRAVWKSELIGLEGSLRELIGEAAEASTLFDSNIQRRQKELELVLSKIEAKVAKVTNSSSHFKVIPSTQDEEIVDPPWVTDDELPRHLRSQLESTSDNYNCEPVTRLTQKASKVRSDRKVSDGYSRSSLREELEVEAVDNDEELFKQTSIVDPAAFKIAKRLLLEGKEIHVISRKLDIPVSEVRHLELLIREASQGETLNSPLKEKELSDVRKVIRDTSNGKKRDLSKEAQVLESLGLGHYVNDLQKGARA